MKCWISPSGSTGCQGLPKALKSGNPALSGEDAHRQHCWHIPGSKRETHTPGTVLSFLFSVIPLQGVAGSLHSETRQQCLRLASLSLFLPLQSGVVRALLLGAVPWSSWKAWPLPGRAERWPTSQG